MNNECIFCKIIAKEIPTTLIDETEDLIVIKDINPKATIHYLIIPKRHIPDLRHFTHDDQSIAGNMLLMAQRLSNSLSEPKAFRLVINNGPEVGQCVFHSHIHFLVGKKLAAF